MIEQKHIIVFSAVLRTIISEVNCECAAFSYLLNYQRKLKPVQGIYRRFIKKQILAPRESIIEVLIRLVPFRASPL